jgi:hypothetical protein
MSDVDSEDDAVAQKKKSVKVVAPGEEKDTKDSPGDVKNAKKMKAIGDRRKRDVRNSDSDLSDPGDEMDFNNDGGAFAPGKGSYIDKLKKVRAVPCVLLVLSAW